jgi:hypothetical protein
LEKRTKELTKMERPFNYLQIPETQLPSYQRAGEVSRYFVRLTDESDKGALILNHRLEDHVVIAIGRPVGQANFEPFFAKLAEVFKDHT